MKNIINYWRRCQTRTEPRFAVDISSNTRTGRGQGAMRGAFGSKYPLTFSEETKYASHIVYGFECNAARDRISSYNDPAVTSRIANRLRRVATCETRSGIPLTAPSTPNTVTRNTERVRYSRSLREATIRRSVGDRRRRTRSPLRSSPSRSDGVSHANTVVRRWNWLSRSERPRRDRRDRNTREPGRPIGLVVVQVHVRDHVRRSLTGIRGDVARIARGV